MARWPPDARGRLMAAAYELYEERGYDATTIADIAAHAGLSKRSYFHHFPDKREVLFQRTEDFLATITGAIAAAPATDRAEGGRAGRSGRSRSRRAASPHRPW